MDGDSQKIAWRQGTTGMSRDFDGDPTSKNKNRSGLKRSPKHSPKTGKKSMSQTHMGDREGAYGGDE